MIGYSNVLVSLRFIWPVLMTFCLKMLRYKTSKAISCFGTRTLFARLATKGEERIRFFCVLDGNRGRNKIDGNPRRLRSCFALFCLFVLLRRPTQLSVVSENVHNRQTYFIYFIYLVRIVFSNFIAYFCYFPMLFHFLSLLI